MGKGGNGQASAADASVTKGNTKKKVTLEELGKHRTPEDAWLTMEGKVYDVSGWDDHPGEYYLCEIIVIISLCS